MKHQKLIARFSIFLLPACIILALILTPIFSIRAAPNTLTFFTFGPGINFGTAISPGRVYDISVATNGDIYAAGMFTQAGWASALNIARWSNGDWYVLREGLNSNVMYVPARVYALALNNYTGDLYAGGTFSHSGDTTGLNGIARWSENSWHALGNGIIDVEHGEVSAIAVGPSGNVYVGGNFKRTDGAPGDYLVYWNGSVWTSFDTDGVVRAIHIDAAENIYVGGEFTKVSGQPVNYVAYWNGNSWSALGEGLDHRVTDLVVGTNGKLYTSTCASYPGTKGEVNFWDGSKWSILGSTDQCIQSLAISSLGNLYAAGGFTQIDGKNHNYIARYFNGDWMPVGSGADNTIHALTADLNGNLYIGGEFGSISGTNASGIVGVVDDDIKATATVEAGQTATAGAATQTAQAALTQTANIPTPTATSTPGPIYLPILENNWPLVVSLDDAPNLCSQAYPIEVGSKSYRDDFETAGDPDWYRFEATHNATYQVTALKTGSLLLPVVRLYDTNCNDLELQGVESDDGTRLLWTNSGPSGWYHVMIYEGYGRFGLDTEYELSVQEVP